MHAISNKNFEDAQKVLTYVAGLRSNGDTKVANTIRKARLLLRAFSKSEPINLM